MPDAKKVRVLREFCVDPDETGQRGCAPIHPLTFLILDVPYVHPRERGTILGKNKRDGRWYSEAELANLIKPFGRLMTTGREGEIYAFAMYLINHTFATPPKPVFPPGLEGMTIMYGYGGQEGFVRCYGHEAGYWSQQTTYPTVYRECPYDFWKDGRPIVVLAVRDPIRPR